MRAGALRNSITIESASESRDSVGQAIQTWSTWATVWASIEPLRGRELIAADARYAEVIARARLRYRAGITPKMRLNVAGVIYQIESVINVGNQNAELELLLSQGLIS